MKKESIEITPKFNPFVNLWIVIIISMFVVGFYNYFTSTAQSTTLSYNHFKIRLEQNIIKEIWINKDQVTAVVKVNAGEQQRYLKTTLPPFEDKAFLELLEKNGVDIHVKSQKESAWIGLLLFLPFLLFLGFILLWLLWVEKQLGGMGGGAFDFMQSSAKKYEKKEISVTFADVAGVENAKKSFMRW